MEATHLSVHNVYLSFSTFNFMQECTLNQRQLIETDSLGFLEYCSVLYISMISWFCKMYLLCLYQAARSLCLENRECHPPRSENSLIVAKACNCYFCPSDSLLKYLPLCQQLFERQSGNLVCGVACCLYPCGLDQSNQK